MIKRWRIKEIRIVDEGFAQILKGIVKKGQKERYFMMSLFNKKTGRDLTIEELIHDLKLVEGDDNMENLEGNRTKNLLNNLPNDPEAAHGEAEDILCQYLKAIGHNDIAEAFEKARDKIGFLYE